MLIVILMTLITVLITGLFHFSVLRILSGRLAAVEMHNSFRILLIIISVFSAHVIEVIMYALVYKIAVFFELGYFRGQAVQGPLDYFYFSIVTFTSLGLGDIFPDEHLRFITGIEALNGLVLIAWSGSFIFVAMNRIWPWRECE